METTSRRDLVHDLFLPTLLFVALGGMTWAVRGCSGFGATPGCIFAGIMWGAAWWFIAREPGPDQSRRYASGWIMLAVTVGLGLSGARGWMQWPSFFEGKMLTRAPDEFVPISRTYGFIWLFIAGVPWAGIGACLLAWCGSLRETRLCHWALRIGCGIAGWCLASFLFHHFPQYFLPLYESLEDRYHDVAENPNLRRLTNDCRFAIQHLGVYLGLLAFEIGRRDWKNALLISTVGIVNGAGWALCQNWKWAPAAWPGDSFNWWRCWESSGGLSIGLAYGIAYFLTNQRMGPRELAAVRSRQSISGPNFRWLLVFLALTLLASLLVVEPQTYRQLWHLAMGKATQESALKPTGEDFWGVIYVGVLLVFGICYYVLRRGRYAREPVPAGQPYGDPNLERFGLYLGLLLGLGLSVRNGLKGWFNLYRGHEDYYSGQLWLYLGPCFLLILLVICLWTLVRPVPRNFRGDLFPHAAAIIWLVLVVQNVIGQLVTGPLDHWSEFAFSIYYLLLFFITAVIVIHYTWVRKQRSIQTSEIA